GVVVVTLNYRLGAFGFFTNAALDQEEGGNSGNQGLWDQTLALQWVQANIAKFGGDPQNVTIFGESAGSLDVCLHVASPKSAGLFTKAISQSGGCTTKNTLKADAAAQNDTFAAALSCSGPTALECLRAKPVADILTQAAATTVRFAQVVEGEFLPKQPRELFDSGAVNKVPYILGSNTDEGTLFTLSAPVTTEDELKAALTRTLPGANIAEILTVYPLSSFASPQAALARIVGDAQLVCSTWDAASRMQKLGGNVWMYNFDVPVVIPTMPNLALGASHGAELVYVFQTSPAFAAENTALSNVMQTYWATFAKTGDPNGAAQLAWPKFSEDTSTRLNFALAPTVVDAFRKPECTFWRQRYDQQFAPPAATTAP
ncbi:MAG: carboxylesterase family protein, partial [Polyangiales bacterium]